VQVKIHVSEEVARVAQRTVMELEDKPFLSVADLFRHAMVLGLMEMIDKGVKVDKLSAVYKMEKLVDDYEKWKEFNEGLVGRFVAMRAQARTTDQYEKLLEMGGMLLEVCSDEVIRGQLRAEIEKAVGI
jgi:hypothetical protein